MYELFRYVLDGNRYFARPSPSLAEGAALIARCAHDGDKNVEVRIHTHPLSVYSLYTGVW